MKINLKNFRQSHGLFQSDLADLLKINQSNISRAEIKGFFELTYPQAQTLYERYGKEDVDSFQVVEEPISVVASNNTNKGHGTQNNGYFGVNTEALNLIRKQSEALIKLADKQAEQFDKLVILLEKVTDKL